MFNVGSGFSWSYSTIIWWLAFLSFLQLKQEQNKTGINKYHNTANTPALSIQYTEVGIIILWWPLMLWVNYSSQLICIGIVCLPRISCFWEIWRNIQEARVGLNCPLSNSCTSFLLCKPPVCITQWFTLVHESNVNIWSFKISKISSTLLIRMK